MRTIDYNLFVKAAMRDKLTFSETSKRDLRTTRRTPPRHPAAAKAVAVLGLFVMAAGLSMPAYAQVRGQTSPDVDPRRARSGAKVTSDVNPEAQEAKDDSERVHDAFQPKGVDLGQFLLLPKLEFDQAYNSNLYATQDDARGDFVSVVRPELKLRSRFKEHALNLTLVAEQYLHRRYTRENRLDLQGELDGRFDFSAETQATGFLQLYSRHEDRSSPDDAGGVEPTPISGIVSRTALKHQVGRYTFGGEFGADRRQFDNVATSVGTVVPNQDRDRWELFAKGRAGYELFPGYAAVGEVTVNTRRYDQTRDRNGFERDSYGYRAEAGIGLDISQLIRGDFLVGYFTQNYEDPRLKDPRGLSLRATFNWTPSKLTIVVPSLERSVSETTSAGASGMVRTGASVTVRHEYDRQMLLTGYAGAYYDELTGIDQDSWTFEGRARITYALMPEAYVAGEVGQRVKRSQISSGGFDQTIVMVRLGLQM